MLFTLSDAVSRAPRFEPLPVQMTLLYPALEGAYPTLESLIRAENPTSAGGLTTFSIYTT